MIIVIVTIVIVTNRIDKEIFGRIYKVISKRVRKVWTIRR